MEACHTGSSKRLVVGGIGAQEQEVLTGTYNAYFPSSSSVIFVIYFVILSLCQTI